MIIKEKDMRETTNMLIDKVYDGELNWEQIARSCLLFMEEEEVKKMVSLVPIDKMDREHVAIVKGNPYLVIPQDD